MNIEILSATPNPLEVIYKACRTCYSAVGPIRLKEKSIDEMISLIDGTIKSGHHSVLEHVSMTFAIEGVSRALTHQLVRHRLASFSQQSQRYVNYCKGKETTDVDFIVPKTIKKNTEALNEYQLLIEEIKRAYKKLIDIGIPAEDARYILPNATETKLIMTMNFRELFTVSSIRLCFRAQWEIVELFGKIKKEVFKIDEYLASKLQPKCQNLGYCNEDKSCGKYTFGSKG